MTRRDIGPRLMARAVNVPCPEMPDDARVVLDAYARHAARSSEDGWPQLPPSRALRATTDLTRARWSRAMRWLLDHAHAESTTYGDAPALAVNVYRPAGPEHICCSGRVTVRLGDDGRADPRKLRADLEALALVPGARRAWRLDLGECLGPDGAAVLGLVWFLHEHPELCPPYIDGDPLACHAWASELARHGVNCP